MVFPALSRWLSIVSSPLFVWEASAFSLKKETAVAGRIHKHYLRCCLQIISYHFHDCWLFLDLWKNEQVCFEVKNPGL